MKNIRLYILIILITFPLVLESQVKYAELREELTMMSITYSRVSPFENIGVQFGYTNKGRIGLGLLFTTSTTHSPNRAAGIFIEGAILKPSSGDLIGIDLGVAGVKTFAAGYGGKIRSVDGVIGTIELFFPSSNIPVSPFIQISGASVKSQFMSSFAIGMDILIDDNTKPLFILTPGLAFSRESPLMVEVDLSIILSRSKK